MPPDTLPPLAAPRLGLPPRYRPFVGGYAGGGVAAGAAAWVGGGVYKDLLNPAAGILGVQAEGYLGASRERTPDVDLALGLRSPILRLGLGVEAVFPRARVAPYVSIMHPVRRGGFLFPGGELHATWTFGPIDRLRLGLAVPVGQPFAGRGRPRLDHVRLAVPPAPRVPPGPAPDAALARAADALAAAAERVADVVVPDLGRAGSPKRPDDARFTGRLRTLAREVAAHGGAVQVLRDYHDRLDRAFSLALDPRAVGVSAAGCALADSARAVLLGEVLLPYDRLLGQKRKPETLAPFAAAALRRFEAEAVPAALGATSSDRATWLMSRLLDAVSGEVSRQRRRWGDERLAWLPLQLALRQDAYATQAQIDALVTRATGVTFSDSNQVAYAHNAEFQYELYRSIHDARSYHVLWVHDFRGLDDAGEPDGVAFQQLAYGYLGALIDRVEAYDSTAALPEYDIFLDQYYYEKDHSRLWMTILRDPLSVRGRIEDLPPSWQAVVDSLCDALRSAVAASHRLRAQERAHGTAWLHERVSVRVHITGQADPSFWSGDVLPLVGLSDNVLRDHHKIAFYDLSEADPYRGELIVAGMGVGEIYADDGWEDRSAVVKGPAAYPVTHAAARLLLRQGVDSTRLPFWARPVDDDAAAAARTPVPSFQAGPARALQVHNQIGYGAKDATIAKAVVYTMMPAGSVLKIPDSLWNNPLWASLLVGQALRGGRVLVMSPSQRNAPAPNFAAMSLAEEMLARMIVASHILGPAIAAAGGGLHVGIYDVDFPVDDIAARIDVALATRARNPWLRRLEPFSREVIDTLHAVARDLRRAPVAERDGEVAARDASKDLDVGSGSQIGSEAEGGEHPKLHIKAQFFSSAKGYDDLLRWHGWGALLSRSLRARAAEGARRPHPPSYYHIEPGDGAARAATRIFERQAAAEGPDSVVYYLMMGSQNEDYRSALLDGEVLLLLSHYGAAVGTTDFVLLPSLCTWVDTVDELHRYLPQRSFFLRWVARATRILY